MNSNIIQSRNILCKVIYDFESKEKHEMSVYAGDVVEVVKRYKDGWSWCYLKTDSANDTISNMESNGSSNRSEEERCGMIPTAYLHEIQSDPHLSIHLKNTNELKITSSNNQFVQESPRKHLEENVSFVISKNLQSLNRFSNNNQKRKDPILNDDDFSEVMTEQAIDQTDSCSVASCRTDCTDLSIGSRKKSKRKEILHKIGSFF